MSGLTRRLMVAGCLLALVLTAACGAAKHGSGKEIDVADRPSLETTVQRYEKFRDDLFDELEQHFGQRAWAQSPNSSGDGQSFCGEDEGDPADAGRHHFFADMSFRGTYPASDWAAIRDLVETVGRAHGFTEVAHVVDRPGDLDMVGVDEFGGKYEFGMAANTVLGMKTGCHLPASPGAGDGEE